MGFSPFNHLLSVTDDAGGTPPVVTTRLVLHRRRGLTARRLRFFSLFLLGT